MKKSKNIYLAYLYGSNSYHIFNDEIDKKWFLDIVRLVQKRINCEVYAFCLLEKEVHFLLGVQNQKLMKLFLNEIIQEFQRYKKDSKLIFCSTYQYKKKMSAAEILEYCRNIHALPLEKKYVKHLRDYWWSSYRDYLRKYSTGIVNTSVIITHLDENENKAMNKFVKLH